MGPPPRQLNGAEVLSSALIDAMCRWTSQCKHSVAGKQIGPVSALAICQYSDAEGYYLLYCDSSWGVITDTWHETMERANEQAEFEYQGISRNWRVPE
jgi:hypothetical protein